MLVAVSGGADSTALLFGAVRAADQLRIEVRAAHLNHKLRGDASDDDAHWVERICDRLNVPLEIDSADVGARAERDSAGLEESARRVRYEFLEDAARRVNCAHVAAAHTADDQAETILHQIIRGTGIAGLRGIARTRPLGDGVALVRPMLDLKRCDARDYLQSLSESFREDATNLDESFTRNRIRRTLIPILEEDYNPKVADALLRLGRQAGDVQDAVESIANAALDCALEHCDASTCRLNGARLRELPTHLVREVLTLVWKRSEWPRQRMGYAEWNRLAALATCDEESGPINLPGGVDATRRGELLVLNRRETGAGRT